MKRQEVREALLEIVAAQLDDDTKKQLEERQEEMRVEELDLDSLDSVEIIMDLSDRLDINIEDEEADAMFAKKNTLGAVIDTLTTKVNEEQAT